jgi:hypothetical protein
MNRDDARERLARGEPVYESDLARDRDTLDGFYHVGKHLGVLYALAVTALVVAVVALVLAVTG